MGAGGCCLPAVATVTLVEFFQPTKTSAILLGEQTSPKGTLLVLDCEADTPLGTVSLLCPEGAAVGVLIGAYCLFSLPGAQIES